ncbi:uncharacterized protein LOC142320422 isoform X1 [Lycorma delicatula]|uniref:uncharacterized protein LOC142320422 isoform X1 n=1 Tax=Lycorma delicatula TaxID=130591 RepID=UPI003F50FE47
MRYLLLKYALKWLKSKPLNDSTKYQELLLLYSMYMCFLQESFNIEIAIEESSFKPLKCFRKDLITTDTIEWFKRKSVKSLTSIQIDKLDLLIGKLLEVGDLATVWCLEAVFHYKTKDSLILDGCLGLAEGEYSPSNLPQDVTQLLSDNSSLSKICYSPDSFSSSLSKMSLSTASSYSLLGDIEDTNTDENLEQKGTLQIVNSLVEIAIHSSRLVQYIYSALRIANRFGMQYKEVTSMDNPLILIENGCDDLHLGKDIIILANLPADQTDFYLCSQIVKAVASSGSKVCVEEPQDLLNSVRSALCTGITNSEVIGKKVADDLEEQPSDTKRGQMS